MRSYLAIIITVLFIVMPAAQAENWRDYFDDGVHYYKIGEYQKASDALQKAIELNPAGEELVAAKYSLPPTFWSSLLSNPETRTSGHKLLEALFTYEESLRKDQAFIDALVEELVAPGTDFQKRWLVIHKLIAVGQYGTPALIKHLGVEKNEDVRKVIRLGLEELDYRAVLPLIEALNSDSLLVRQNAVITLGVIGDPRAAAALKAISESETEEAELKQKADMALKGIKKKTIKCKIFGDVVEPIEDKKGDLQYEDHRAYGLYLKGGEFKPAKELYLYKALRYLRETAFTSQEAAKDEGVIWIWNKADQSLSSRKVSLYMYNELMAEEACYDCFNLYPDYDTIIPVLISAVAAQIVEVENLLAVSDDKAVGFKADQESKDMLIERLEVVKEAFVLANMAGPQYLYKALEINCQRIARMMKDSGRDEQLIQDYTEYGHDAETFRYICKQLQNPEVGQWPGFFPVITKDKGKKDSQKVDKPGFALTTALAIDDKIIKYAAAIAVGSMNPTKNFVNAELVVPILTKALGESKNNVILLISKSLNDLNKLSSLSSGLGYVAQLANSGSEGLKKARGFPVEDVIVLDARDSRLDRMVDAFGQRIEAEYRGQTLASFVKDIKSDLYTRNAPIVFIVADEEQQALYENDDLFRGQIAGFIRWAPNDMIDENYYADIILNVMNSTTLKEKNKEDALVVASEAAQALSKIDIDTGILAQYTGEAVPVLIEVIVNREDPIRIPSLEALGKYRVLEAIENIVLVLEHPRTSKDARLACIRALGRIDPTEEKAYQALKKALLDKDFDIRKETGLAFGRKSLDAKRLLEIFEQNRMEKDKKEF